MRIGSSKFPRNTHYTTLVKYWGTVCLLVLVACSTAGKQGASTPSVGESYPAVDPSHGSSVPNGPTSINGSTATYGPQPVSVHPVTLIFGPGHVRSFAAAGVLRALHEAEIPVRVIAGTGMGGLLAAIYSTAEGINKFEWRLSQIKEGFFIGSGLSRILKRKSDGAKLFQNLSNSLRNVRIEQIESKYAKKLLLGVRSDDHPVCEWVEQGELAATARAVTAEMEILEPYRSSESCWDADIFPVAMLKERFGYPVIVVDTLSDLENTSDNIEIVEKLRRIRQDSQKELDQADLVIQPNLKEINPYHWQHRTLAVFRGKIAAKESIDKLRALSGLPPKEDSHE